jgi:hypothetical protein
MIPCWRVPLYYPMAVGVSPRTGDATARRDGQRARIWRWEIKYTSASNSRSNSSSEHCVEIRLKSIRLDIECSVYSCTLPGQTVAANPVFPPSCVGGFLLDGPYRLQRELAEALGQRIQITAPHILLFHFGVNSASMRANVTQSPRPLAVPKVMRGRTTGEAHSTKGAYRNERLSDASESSSIAWLSIRHQSPNEARSQASFAPG